MMKTPIVELNGITLTLKDFRSIDFRALNAEIEQKSSTLTPVAVKKLTGLLEIHHHDFTESDVDKLRKFIPALPELTFSDWHADEQYLTPLKIQMKRFAPIFVASMVAFGLKFPQQEQQYHADACAVGKKTLDMIINTQILIHYQELDDPSFLIEQAHMRMRFVHTSTSRQFWQRLFSLSLHIPRLHVAILTTTPFFIQEHALKSANAIDQTTIIDYLETMVSAIDRENYAGLLQTADACSLQGYHDRAIPLYLAALPQMTTDSESHQAQVDQLIEQYFSPKCMHKPSLFEHEMHDASPEPDEGQLSDLFWQLMSECSPIQKLAKLAIIAESPQPVVKKIMDHYLQTLQDNANPRKVSPLSLSANQSAAAQSTRTILDAIYPTVDAQDLNCHIYFAETYMSLHDYPQAIDIFLHCLQQTLPKSETRKILLDTVLNRYFLNADNNELTSIFAMGNNHDAIQKLQQEFLHKILLKLNEDEQHNLLADLQQSTIISISEIAQKELIELSLASIPPIIDKAIATHGDNPTEENGLIIMVACNQLKALHKNPQKAWYAQIKRCLAGSLKTQPKEVRIHFIQSAVNYALDQGYHEAASRLIRMISLDHTLRDKEKFLQNASIPLLQYGLKHPTLCYLAKHKRLYLELFNKCRAPQLRMLVKIIDPFNHIGAHMKARYGLLQTAIEIQGFKSLFIEYNGWSAFCKIMQSLKPTERDDFCKKPVVKRLIQQHMFDRFKGCLVRVLEKHLKYARAYIFGRRSDSVLMAALRLTHRSYYKHTKSKSLERFSNHVALYLHHAKTIQDPESLLVSVILIKNHKFSTKNAATNRLTKDMESLERYLDNPTIKWDDKTGEFEALVRGDTFRISGFHEGP